MNKDEAQKWSKDLRTEQAKLTAINKDVSRSFAERYHAAVKAEDFDAAALGFETFLARECKK